MIENLREIYQIKVQLKGVRPPIWRRFWVLNTASLEDFHHTLQIVMGWTNSHLHQFTVGQTQYGMVGPDFDNDWNENLRDECDFKIKYVLKKEGDSLLYEYDFGDGWEHKVVLEKRLPYDSEQVLPYCLKGKRGCPPENVGGVWGYRELLEKWHDESHPEHEEIHDWAGDYFEPDEFYAGEVNEILEDVFLGEE